MIKPSSLLIGQSVGEPTPKLSPSTSSNRATEPFNCRKWWADDAACAQLNALMGRSPDEAIDIDGSYRPAAQLPSLDELKRIAIEHRPELAGLRLQIVRASDEGQLTRLAMKPDLTTSAGYMLMPTGSMSRNAYMAEVTMNLPWWNRARHDGEAKQADAATDVVKAELDARTTAVFLEIRQAEIVVRSAQLRVKLFPFVIESLGFLDRHFATSNTLHQSLSQSR